MLLVGTIFGALLLAVGHTTLFPGFSLFVIVIGLALFVDISLAVVFGLVAGLLLDVLDVHVLGVSSALLLVAAAGIVDVARHSVRAFSDRPVQFYLAAAVLASFLTPLSYGASMLRSTVLAVLLRAAVHLVLALALLPFFRTVGARHQDGLREHGIL